MAELTIVIPTIGRSGTLRRVLERLEDQRGSLRFEVVVAIDVAEPNPELVTEAIGSRPYPTRVVSGARAGASAGRNAGWRDAEAAIVLFLDDDVLPEPRLVEEHVAWHRRFPEPEVGVLGRVRWADELRVTPFMRWVEDGVQFDYGRIHGTEAGWGRFYTANASVKRSLIERTRGFDEIHLPFGYEDLDLAYRMHERGFRLLYNKAASAEHLHPMDLAMWRRRVRRIAASERAFCALHPEIPPHFFNLFSKAEAAPKARGRGIRLAPLIPRRFPWLGERVWQSLDAAYRQALAPEFLDAWRRAAPVEGTAVEPDLAERSSGRSRPPRSE